MVDVKALGPNPASVIQPAESLAELLANVSEETSIDSAAWNRRWATIEAEMKQRDMADDRLQN